MKQLLQSKYSLFTFLAFLLFTVASCNKDTGISLDSSKDGLGVTLLDSFTINTSTVQLEYIPTATTGNVLVGKTDHPETGATIASSYFRLAFQSIANDIPVDAVFDSVNLIMTPTAARYYYGDTTRVQTVHVHRVNETIESKTINPIIGASNIPVYITGTSIFSDQKFAYDATALGSLTFTPHVKSRDSLSIRLQDNFGKDIFDLINAGGSQVSSNDNFQQYLKGLVLVPDDQNSAILAYKDTVFLDLNYKYTGSDGFVRTGKKTLVTASRAFQYNNIDYDRSGTAYATLNKTNSELPSSATNGDVFLQAGTGVVAKLDFPSFREFLNEPNMAINKVELIVETTGSNFGDFANPNGLMLLIANKHTGVPISYVPAPYSTSIQTAPLVPGSLIGINSKYTFNLIDYIRTVNNVANQETCLYLAVSSPNLFGTTNMAMIAKEGTQPKVKLNVVYTKFK